VFLCFSVGVPLDSIIHHACGLVRNIRSLVRNISLDVVCANKEEEVYCSACYQTEEGERSVKKVRVGLLSLWFAVESATSLQGSPRPVSPDFKN
jgi:hypothetical protein